ncbi:DUF2948 family protein [Marivita hallyeonensis]|uniref:DUF2948 domain-containing protein n=1 Tax=Marivita hallyeonensis TaxID=996342 RepID=A0A1M5WAY1_9RHOB|nr:DUF2948 family protein [Marivita hallyeonensis]SHH84610.1 Protein of unknown function [Marivita hallyeonensis]
MTEDATFESGAERPLRLVAMDTEDLQILSALCQDAVFPATEMQWQPRQKRFGLLINRFRWEDIPAAQRGTHKPERVQSVLAVENVVRVSSQGVDRSDTDTILSLLSVSFDEGGSALELTLAGDGALRLQVDELEVALRDVTRPYVAVSGKVPDHPE